LNANTGTVLAVSADDRGTSHLLARAQARIRVRALARIKARAKTKTKAKPRMARVKARVNKKVTTAKEVRDTLLLVVKEEEEKTSSLAAYGPSSKAMPTA
jgi:hypothetical protein